MLVYVSSRSFLNFLYSTAAVIADVTSANGVARVTPLSPSSILKTYIAGISTTPFLMIDRIKEDLLLPAAWKMVLAMKDSAHRGAAKAMTLRNLVPNSTEAGSLMKKVMNLLWNKVKVRKWKCQKVLLKKTEKTSTR